MVDSGIKLEEKLQEQLKTFKEIKKAEFDYVIGGIELDGIVNKKEHFVVKVRDSKAKGECEACEGECDPAVGGSVYAALKKILHSKEYEKKACFIAFYFTYGSSLGVQEKLIAVLWNPDDGPMKEKMKYSSTFESFKKAVPKYNAYAECNDLDDFKHEEIKKKCKFS